MFCIHFRNFISLLKCSPNWPNSSFCYKTSRNRNLFRLLACYKNYTVQERRFFYTRRFKDKKLRSSQKPSENIYITNIEDAEYIASCLTEGWKEGYIFEANPGFGILSEAILRNKVSHLRVFEKNKDFLPALEVLSDKYPSLEIVIGDLLLLPSFDSRVVGECNEFEKIFHGVPEYEWTNGVPFRLFAIISSKRSIKFIRYLLAVLPSKTSAFSFGRCELFFLLREAEYLYMKAEPKENLSTYRWSTVLYNLFFEITCLKKFASDTLFTKSSSNGRKKITTGQNFYLVKLVPRHDLFSSLVNSNKLPDLYFFVRHHLVKRTALVIPTMEGWIPFCGPRLIKEGMNVFTKFGDLSPNQILMLFNQFSSWPEYQDSTFHAALLRFYGKENFPYEDEDSAT